MRHFLIPLAIKFLNPKILGSLYPTKNGLGTADLGSKM